VRKKKKKKKKKKNKNRLDRCSVATTAACELGV